MNTNGYTYNPVSQKTDDIFPTIDTEVMQLKIDIDKCDDTQDSDNPKPDKIDKIDSGEEEKGNLSLSALHSNPQPSFYNFQHTQAPSTVTHTFPPEIPRAPSALDLTKETIKSNVTVFRRLFTDSMRSSERRLFYFVLVATFCCGALRLVFFIFVAGIVDLMADTYFSDLHHICNLHEYITCDTNHSLIHVFTIALIFVSIFGAIFAFARTTLTSMAVCSFLRRLNVEVFDKLMDQTLSFFQGKNQYDLNILLTNDMKTIRVSLHHIVIIIQSCIHFLCGVMYLFIVNWDIALIVVGSFVLLFMASIIYIQKSESVEVIRRKAFKFVTLAVVETLNYITTIKTFSKEEDESYIYEQLMYKAFSSVSEQNSLLYAYRFWMSIISYFTVLTIIWYAAYLIFDVHSNVTLGVLAIDLLIFMQLNWSMYHIVTLCPSVAVKGGESILRMFQVIDIKNKTNKEQSYIPPECSIGGKIEIRNLMFAYPHRKHKLVLDNISMQFYPSTTTALVGVNGSGKSTILKILMRFFETQSGEILIDGKDHREYNLAFLHSQIGYVPHNVALFENRTICENIKFGMKLDRKSHFNFDAEYFNEEKMFFWRKTKSIQHSDVEKVAKIANAHDFIMQLDKGYDTKIGGERGIQLSHGEKQRIGIARALLLDPKILLLDEALSGMDTVSKKLIQEALDRIMIGRCVIVIAHRLKTVENANRIYVIKNGKIVGCGLHSELVESHNQHYMELTNRNVFVE